MSNQEIRARLTENLKELETKQERLRDTKAFLNVAMRPLTENQSKWYDETLAELQTVKMQLRTVKDVLLMLDELTGE